MQKEQKNYMHKFGARAIDQHTYIVLQYIYYRVCLNLLSYFFHSVSFANGVMNRVCIDCVDGNRRTETRKKKKTFNY